MDTTPTAPDPAVWTRDQECEAVELERQARILDGQAEALNKRREEITASLARLAALKAAAAAGAPAPQ